VGDVQEAYPAAIRTIGYVPKRTYPSWKVDPRYRQIRFTDGVGFSALEALQYWIDLVAAGIQPSQVKLLDVAGRTIAAVECRIALALGASVGVVEGSGYEAAKLLLDEDWENVPGLFPLPPDAMTARAFISSGIPKLDSTVRETIAKAIHESYREMESSIRSSRDPALAHWDSLLDDYKESNRQQADHISEKLLQIGLAVHYVKDQQPKEIQLTVDEVEVMAEMEHGRWIVERLKEGWKWAPERDVAKRTSPYILPWSQLAEEVREQNREIVRRIPEFLASVGMEIRRK
jgi:hypothetical protein